MDLHDTLATALATGEECRSRLLDGLVIYGQIGRLTDRYLWIIERGGSLEASFERAKVCGVDPLGTIPPRRAEPRGRRRASP